MWWLTGLYLAFYPCGEGGGEGEEAFVAFFLVGEKSGDLYTKQIYWEEQGDWKIKWKSENSFKKDRSVANGNVIVTFVNTTQSYTEGESKAGA